jgi:NAD/NADP transhydrogenase beta subunit
MPASRHCRDASISSPVACLSSVVDVRAAVSPALEMRVARATRLARVLDTALRIPGTRIRFGLDPILGLLPGLGDAIAALLGGYMVWTAVRAGAPRLIVGRMLANIAVDAIVGAVPVAGTVFDVAFKAHRRNARMLTDWSQQPAAIEARERRAVLALASVLLALALIAAAALAFGIWAMLRLLG